MNNYIKEEVEFNEAKQKFEELYAKIIEAILAYENASQIERTQIGISEIDYIRLCQFEQHVKKVKPKRDFIEYKEQDEKNQRRFFRKIISNARQQITSRFFSIKDKNQKENEVKNFTNSFLLVQECEKYLNELIHCDEVLKNQNRENISDIEDILDNSPEGQVIRHRHGGPGILDNYRRESWGIKRICLDGMQNHLPSDSMGTACFLHFMVDGKWVAPGIAKLTPEKITKVRFADNGVGFMPENLLLLGSTKSNEEKSVGQFGEGMKLASMAAINLGLGQELQSRNWIAHAIGDDQILVNTRKNDAIENHKSLGYDIDEYDGEKIVGSRTIFNTPTPEFIDFALKLPEYILPLNPEYVPRFTTNNGDIVTCQQSGKIYVKGIYVKNVNSMFSYNFDDANVNPDRNDVVDFNVSYKITQIIRELNDLEIMKTLIAKMMEYKKNNPNQDQDNYYYNDNAPSEVNAGYELYRDFKEGRGVPTLWRQAFMEVCEHDNAVTENGSRIEAVLKTDYEVPEQLKNTLKKYNVVVLPKKWEQALHEAGVKTDRESLPEYIETVVPTSFSLKYGEKIWEEERTALDAIQNHLPADSGGTKIFLHFQTNDGEWHDYKEFHDFEDGDIKKIKISDNGRGYDYQSLGMVASVKNHEQSSGKWGEGLKMLSLAALRKGIKMELRSREWMAIPVTQDVTLNKGEENQAEVKQLLFNVITKVNSESKILEDGDDVLKKQYGENVKKESSSTTFIDPTPDLIRVFRNIGEKVLAFSDKKAILEMDGSEIIGLNEGKLFIRDILIPGEHNIKYSYNLKKFDIETRDRNAITVQSLKEQIRQILENTNSDRFISTFLRDAIEYAKEHRDTGCLEFETSFDISNQYLIDKWIEVFKQDYGDKTSIRRSSDQDMDAVHQAQHVGLDMVTLPDCIANSLSRLQGSKGQTIPSYASTLSKMIGNAIDLNEDKLTEYEKKMIKFLLDNYNKFLSEDEPPIKSIQVFTYPDNYTGPRAAGLASKGDCVKIERFALNGDLLELGNVFFHEAGHAITGASDAEKAFRDFFTNLLSSIAMKNTKLQKSIIDNGIARGITPDKVKDVIDNCMIQEQQMETGDEDMTKR